MSRRPRLLLLLLLCLLSGVAVAAERRTLVVGFAQDTLANDWRMAQVQGLQRAFAAYPWIHFIYTDGKGRTATQIRDIEDLVHRPVDLLITSPRDSRAAAPAVAQAYAQGIPVVLLTRAIDSQDYTTFIAPDDAGIAADAARYMAQRLHGKGRVLILQGVPSASTAVARTQGFLTALKAYPQMQVAAIKVGNYLRSDAIRAVEEALREGIAFDAIYAQSDSMASGARIALDKAGIDPAGLVMVGIDYIQEARRAIRAGRQSASYTYPTCAEAAARAVVDILEGRSVPKHIPVPSQRVTRENVDDVQPIF